MVKKDHLSRLKYEEDKRNHKFPMEEEFLDEQIMALYTHIKGLPWFTKYANYKVCGVIPKKLN